MEQTIVEYLAKVLKPDTVILLVAIYFLYRKIGKIELRMHQIEDGVRVGLLAHLTRIHSGAMQNKSIAKDTLRIAEEIYKRYHDELRGNGYGTVIMSEIRELPLK